MVTPLPVDTAVTELRAYEDGLTSNIQNVREIRGGVGDVLDTLEIYDRYLAKIEGLRDDVATFGDDLGKLQVVIKLLEKVSALKSVAGAVDDIVGEVKDFSRKVERDLDAIIDKIDSSIGAVVDKAQGMLEDFDGNLASVEGTLVEQRDGFASFNEGLQQMRVVSDAPLGYAGRLVEVPVDALQFIDEKYDEAKALVNKLDADVPGAKFQLVLDLEVKIGKVTGVLDKISGPLDVAYGIVKNIEWMLDAVEKFAAPINEAVDRIQDEVGITEIIDAAKDQVFSLLPNVDIFSTFLEVQERAEAALIDFTSDPPQGSDKLFDGLPDPLEIKQWIEENLVQSLLETAEGETRARLGELSAEGYGVALELDGAEDTDGLTALVQDIVLIGDEFNNEINAIGGENVLVGGYGDDTLNGSDDDSDAFFGGQGNDLIRAGSSDDDVAIYLGSITQYILSQASEGAPIIIEHVLPFEGLSLDGRDTLEGVEILQFGDRQVALETLLDNSIRIAPGQSSDVDPDEDDPYFLFAEPAGGTPQGVTLQGALGDDVIAGQLGNDSLQGGAGNDAIQGGGGVDTVDGGSGIDTFVYAPVALPSSGAPDVHLDLQEETEQFSLQNGDQVATLISIENVTADKARNALMFGDEGDNALSSGDGRDLIDGRDGNDRLDGGANMDTLIGGAGRDSVFGGADNDILIVGGPGPAGQGELYDGGEGQDRLIYNDNLTGGGGSAPRRPLNEAFLRDNQKFTPVNRVEDLSGSGPVNIFADEDRVERLSANRDTVLAEDTAVSIEYWEGSDFDDVLRGSTGPGDDETLDGAGGQDIIYSGDRGGLINVDETYAGVPSADGNEADIVYAGTGGATYRGDQLDTLDLSRVDNVRWYAADANNAVKEFLALPALDEQDVEASDARIAFEAGDIVGFGRIIGSEYDDFFRLTRGGKTTVEAGGGDDTVIFNGGASPNDGRTYYGFGGEGADHLEMFGEGEMHGELGDDVLIAKTTKAATLLGGEGSDVVYLDMLNGGLVDGGAGTDILIAHTDIDGRLSVDLTAGRVTGGDGDIDAIARGFEIVIGTDGATGDVLVGGVAGEQLIGGAGSDVLEGRAGASNNPSAGPSGRDLLFGNSGNDRLYGGDDDDLLNGGSGDDTIDGGDGIDTASWEVAAPGTNLGALDIDTNFAVQPVFVDLEAGTAQSAGHNDRLYRIENVIGSFADDDIKGDGGANELRGAAGADTVDGRGGDDLIIIEGDDTAQGGEGDDTFLLGAGNADIGGGSGADTLDMTRLDGLDTTQVLYDPESGRYRIEISEDVPVWADTGSEEARVVPGGTVAVTPLEVLGADLAFADDNGDIFRTLPEDEQFALDFVSRLTSYEGTFDGIEVFEGGQQANLEATAGADDMVTSLFGGVLDGGGGNDFLRGLETDDRFKGSGGSDTIEGGAGKDTALLDGGFGNYILTIDGTSNALLLAAKSASGSGRDTLQAIELLEFSDGSSFVEEGAVDLASLTGAAGLSEDALSTFVEMYIAYFDRAPDALGLLYWGTRLADGMSLPEIAASFFVQPESREAYPDPDDSAKLVDDAYNNLLERDPEAEGRSYWIGELENGNVSRAEFMLAIINGAKADTGDPDDVTTITEKAEIGYSYAVTNGLTDVDNAVEVMEAYDRENADPSLAAAQTLIEEFRSAAASENSSEIVIELIALGSDPLGV